MQHFDIVIVGAGMIGLALANAVANTLAANEKSIAIINSEPPSRALSDAPELRVSALNLSNQQHFSRLGVWKKLNAGRLCEYTHMHVWEQDSFGEIQFQASDAGTTHLGTIVENQALVNALHEVATQQASITFFAPAKIKNIALGEVHHAIVLEDGSMLSADLIVGADGANSLVRKTANLPVTFKDYGQSAIVATVETDMAHNHCARQVFTEHGPLALLPLNQTNQCSIVWSQTTSESKRLLSLDDNEFNKALTVTSNHLLGQLRLVSARKSFPLKMQYARQWLSNKVVLCGDAAHTIHPLAGQGANLGFGDVWHLAECINNGEPLREYERARKTAAVKMIAGMEGFHQLYTASQPVKKLIRSAGLSLFDKATPLKQPFLKEALGLD